MNAQTKKTPQAPKVSGAAHVLSTRDIDVPKVDKDLSVGFSQWVRALMQNWRQGTVACKDRSEVSFSNKKPWKQKGTGRARAGSPRSPIWRHGGVTFGPQPRTRTLRVTRSVKNAVLQALFAQRMHDGSVIALDWQPSETPKTAQAFSALKAAGLHDKKIVFFVGHDDVITYASYANMPNIRLVFFDQMNAVDGASGDCWVVLKKDVEQFKEMVSRWI